MANQIQAMYKTSALSDKNHLIYLELTAMGDNLFFKAYYIESYITSTFSAEFSLEELMKESNYYKQFDNAKKLIAEIKGYKGNETINIKEEKYKIIIIFPILSITYNKINFTLILKQKSDKEKIEEYEKVIEKFKSEVKDLNDNKIILDEKLKEYEKIIEKYKNEIKDLNNNKIVLDEKLKDYEKAIEKYKKEIKDLNENKIVLMTKDLNDNKTILDEKIKEYEKVIEKYKNEIKDLNDNKIISDEKIKDLNDNNKIEKEKVEKYEIIIEKYKNEVENLKNGIKDLDERFLINGFDSNILEIKNHNEIIKMWISPFKKISAKLLYNFHIKYENENTYEYNDVQNFHSKCDNRPNILIICKSKNEIFGGFTPLCFASNNSYGSDNNSFVFSINKLKKYPKIYHNYSCR